MTLTQWFQYQSVKHIVGGCGGRCGQHPDERETKIVPTSSLIDRMWGTDCIVDRSYVRYDCIVNRSHIAVPIASSIDLMWGTTGSSIVTNNNKFTVSLCAQAEACFAFAATQSPHSNYVCWRLCSYKIHEILIWLTECAYCILTAGAWAPAGSVKQGHLTPLARQIFLFWPYKREKFGILTHLYSKILRFWPTLEKVLRAPLSVTK